MTSRDILRLSSGYLFELTKCNCLKYLTLLKSNYRAEVTRKGRWSLMSTSTQSPYTYSLLSHIARFYASCKTLFFGLVCSCLKKRKVFFSGFSQQGWTAGQDTQHLFTWSKPFKSTKLHTIAVSISYFTRPLNTYSTRCSLRLGVCSNLQKTSDE